VWFAGTIERHENAFYACLLFISGGAIGAFASIDLFFFYAFHELALIPTFLLIGIWGSGNRVAAAWKITIYLAIGSFILLLGLILLYQSFPLASRSFDIRVLQTAAGMGQIAPDAQRHVYLLLLIGFGILSRSFRSHVGAGSVRRRASARCDAARRCVEKIWVVRALASSHSDAARRRPSLGDSALVLLLGNIIYVGLVTIAQKRLDWMLGYSSVMHMGYIFLGIASFGVLGVTGAVVLIFAHGLSIALLFGIAGELRRRTGTWLLMNSADLQGDAFRRAVLWTWRVRRNRSSGFCQFRRGNHDLFWRVQERLGNRAVSHFPNRTCLRYGA
jgi:NADH:ubiquinone oxidoreductase subunit 4 (chain M)